MIKEEALFSFNASLIVRRSTINETTINGENLIYDKSEQEEFIYAKYQENINSWTYANDITKHERGNKLIKVSV